MSNQPQAHVAVPAVAPTIDERCTFERACREGKVADNFAFQLDEDDGYKWAATRRLFRFWQAARAAIPAGANDLVDIPTGVYYSADAANFYCMMSKQGMGMDFAMEWRECAHMFPQSDFRASNTAAGAPAGTVAADIEMARSQGRVTLTGILPEKHGIAPAETPKPVAWSVGLHLFHLYDEALRSVRNPDLKPEPLYAAQPAPAPATDARDGERYRKLKTLSKPQLLIWRGAFGCSDEAIDELLDLLSANSPPTDITT